MVKKCIICGESFTTYHKSVKTCGSKECKFEAKSQASKIARTGKKWTNDMREKHSEWLKEKFANGEMKCMKKIWKETAKRWKGNKNPRWKPIGSTRMSHEYIMIKITEGKWIKEERYKMMKKLGRELRKNEVVHHKNKIKNDNRLSNLQLMTAKEHRRLHLKDNINKI